MRVPRELLRDTMTVEDYGGSGALGPIYTARAQPVRASVQSTSRLISDTNGETVTADTLVLIRPEDGPIRAESRVVARGIKFRVAECYAMPDERRPSHYELTLVRYASGA